MINTVNSNFRPGQVDFVFSVNTRIQKIRRICLFYSIFSAFLYFIFMSSSSLFKKKLQCFPLSNSSIMINNESKCGILWRIFLHSKVQLFSSKRDLSSSLGYIRNITRTLYWEFRIAEKDGTLAFFKIVFSLVMQRASTLHTSSL